MSVAEPRGAPAQGDRHAGAGGTGGTDRTAPPPPDRPRRRVPAVLRRPIALVAWVLLALILLVSVLAPVVAPYDPALQDPGATLLTPGSPGHLLGTDNFGRDQLTRVLYGGRPLIITAIASVVLAAVAGALIGLVAGYRGGWTDTVAMRAMDVLLSFPLILLAIMVVAALGTGLVNLVLAVAVSQVPVFARLVRALTLREARREYVLAARAAGFPPARILFGEVTPNLLGPLVVQATSTVAVATGYAAAMSYLGLGIQPPTADWGLMVKEGQQYLFQAPDLVIVPGLLITAFVTACNFAGDDLRDRLDPGGALTGKEARQ
jgi:peptide/nickel transport system permease protein